MEQQYFDTLGYVKQLEAVGIPREHAEAQAGAINRIFIDQLATKADLKNLSQEIRSDFKQRLHQLEVHVEKQRTGLQNQMYLQTGLIVSILGGLVALIEFL